MNPQIKVIKDYELIKISLKQLEKHLGWSLDLGFNDWEFTVKQGAERTLLFNAENLTILAMKIDAMLARRNRSYQFLREIVNATPEGHLMVGGGYAMEWKDGAIEILGYGQRFSFSKADGDMGFFKWMQLHEDQYGTI